MVIVFALLAALSNAVNEATQHVASTAAPSRSSGWRLVLYLFRNPLWLFGWVALAAAFLFQALALHNGLVSVVQPLLATELVFMLVLRRFWLHQSIRLITWGAAALTGVSLTVFVVAGQPGGGQPTPISHRWFTAGLACCAGAAVLAVLALRVSQPFLVIIDPIVSIALSVWLFGERFTANATVLAVAAVAFAVMCAAVVLLTQTAPATMKADLHNGKEDERDGHGP